MILAELKNDLEKLALHGRLRECMPILGRQDGCLDILGKKLVDFSSWDYLSISTQREVTRALQITVEERGISPGSSRTVTGTAVQHLSAEKRLADFLGTESALMLSSRNQAMWSLVTAVATEGDIFYADEHLQSPASDAAYLVNASVETFKDVSALESLLRTARGHRRRFIVVDSLSPVNGATADLSRLYAAATRYECNLIIDESFALGILGPRGAGGGEVLAIKLNHPVQRNIFAFVADLSFGIGCYGAAVAGSKTLIDYVINRSRSLTVDAALPAAIAAATEAALNAVELKLADRERILTMAQRVKGVIPAPVLLTPLDAASPIVVMLSKKLNVAHEIAAALFRRGIFVEVLPRATLFDEGGIVRMIFTSAHTEKHIDDLVRALSEIQLRSE